MSAIDHLPTVEATRRIARAVPKGQPRVLARIERQQALAAQERACRKAVRTRDGGTCRVCGRPAAELHHLTYRSRGGTWDAENIIALCLGCHRFAHAGLLELRGPSSKFALKYEVSGEVFRHITSGPLWKRLQAQGNVSS